MWAYLQRQGIPVARCTVERLMRASGWRGTTRARTDRTTVPRAGDARAPDLVNRQFTAAAPDRCTSPTSPTCRSTAADSVIPRW